MFLRSRATNRPGWRVGAAEAWIQGMRWWNERAQNLQDRVRESEFEKSLKHPSLYGEEDVAQATVHTRQDLILAVSLLSSLNEQVRIIKWATVTIALIAIVMAVCAR